MFLKLFIINGIKIDMFEYIQSSFRNNCPFDLETINLYVFDIYYQYSDVMHALAYLKYLVFGKYMNS